jgi:hypothetical protein
MVLVLNAKNIASLIEPDWTPVVKEHVHQDNAMVTNISQDLVNMPHAVWCKELQVTAEAVKQLYVVKMKSKMSKVMDA